MERGPLGGPERALQQEKKSDADVRFKKLGRVSLVVKRREDQEGRTTVGHQIKGEKKASSRKRTQKGSCRRTRQRKGLELKQPLFLGQKV